MAFGDRFGRIARNFFATIDTTPDEDDSDGPATGGGDTYVNRKSPVGNSGTPTYGGYTIEDHIADLNGQRAADTYHSMTRSDYQVSMLLDIIKNPILSAQWSVAAASDDDDDKEIADYIQAALFERMGTEARPRSFKGYLVEALTFLEHGYSVFEVTHKLDTIPGQPTRIGVNAIGFRDQRTIQRILLDPADESVMTVEQRINNDLTRPNGNGGVFAMDGKDVFFISRNMKGANFQGESILRPVFGNYIRKNALLKFGIVGAEKTAVGFPYATVKPGQEGSSRAKYLARILSYIRTHEMMGAVITENEKLETLQIPFDGTKLTAMVDAEDTRMTKRFLANFLELGVGGKGGAYSLGQDLSDIFFSTIRIVAEQVAEPIDRRIIRTLVDANFGPQEKYPKLAFSGIEDYAGKEFADVLTALKAGGLVQVSEALVKYVHKMYHLPDFDPDLGMPSATPVPDPNAPDPNAPPELDEDGNPIEPDPNAPPPAAPPKAGAKPVPPKPGAKPPVTAKTPAPAAKTPAQKLAEQAIKELFAAATPTTQLIRDQGKALGDAMVADMSRRNALMLASAEKAMRAGAGRKEIIDIRLQVPGKAQYSDMLTKALTSVSVRTSENLAAEMGDQSLAFADDISRFLNNAPAKTKDRLRRQVDMIVESTDADLRKSVVFSYNNNVDSLDSVDAVIKKMRDASQTFLDGTSLTAAASNAVSNTVNLTRNDIFLSTPGLIESINSFVVTNPSPEAAICIALQGRVISPDDYKTMDLPPWHHFCETFLVAQSQDKENKKPISPLGLTPDPADVPGKSLEQILNSKTL